MKFPTPFCELKNSIAIYLQHYLAPSMTFIYRQIKGTENFFDPFVLCSDRLENTDKFPFKRIYLKRRNFARLKKSRIAEKLYGPHTLLSLKPKLSYQQKKYFKDILKNNRTKLIHAHFGPSGLEIMNLSRKLDIPLLVTFHGYDASILLGMDQYVKNIKKLFEHSYIITVSDIMKQRLVSFGADPQKIFIVKCGIPVDFFEFIDRKPLSEKFESGETITFLQVSSFVEKKGHKYTLLAFKEFIKQFKNARLILAGDGYLRNSIERFCSELNIHQNVQFTGVINSEEVKRLMNNADVFVHHSITSEQGDQEGIPTVIMEAMATGLPVISTFHSGIPELIDNNKNGFLIHEKDVDAYTKVLTNLEFISDDIGQNARDTILKDFNLEVQ
ncbi:MAG: glycosyltransferase, partial [Ignavibacteriales bacterium]